MIDHLSPDQLQTVKIRIRAHQNIFVDPSGFVGEKVADRSQIWPPSKDTLGRADGG